MFGSGIRAIATTTNRLPNANKLPLTVFNILTKEIIINVLIRQLVLALILGQILNNYYNNLKVKLLAQDRCYGDAYGL